MGRETASGRSVIRVQLLGGLAVELDGRRVTQDDFPTRRAAELVALLALAGDRRRVRDQVIDALWPHLGAQAGAANLRKAAHHARRALGDPAAVALEGGQVLLLPGRDVVTDVETFLDAAAAALAGPDAAACGAVADGWAGDVLPGAPYEAWTQDVRRRVRGRMGDLLRRAGRWERLLELEPTDEAACRELMRAALHEGRRHAAIRWFEGLRLALARDLGVRPDPQTRALYDRCTAGIRLGDVAFVGRELEVAQALGVLQRTAAGGSAAILVRGGTGIGKSALTREVAQRAGEAGWRTVSVAATAAGPPYGPVAAAVEELLVGARDAVADLPERTRAVLAELTPLAGDAPPVPGALTRHQVIAAIRRVLALPGAPPTLLCVEDAHLADEASADVLHQLVAGTSGGTSLVVVLAARSEWVRTSLPHGLVELGRHGATLQLTLGPLPDGEIARLVGTVLGTDADDARVATISVAADGSPFFALELARAGAGGDRLPQTLRAAITERFVGLGARTMDELAKLAVAEDELDLATVLALTGLPEEGAFSLLDAALGAGVLVVAGTRYRFRHHLVRQALVDALAPHHRLALHRAAAERLVAAGAPAALVADHWLRGERPQEAARWLLAAARHAAGLGAFADALAEVERLLVAAPGNRDGLCLRAEVLDALGDPRAPDAYAAAAEATGPPEDQELRARQALAQLKASDPASALRTLEGVTPRSTVGRLAEALTLSAAAAIGFYADAATAAAKAEEAHALALELGDPGAVLDATWAHALAAHAQGELPARLRGYLRSTAALPEIATRVFDGQLCVTERMLYGGLPNSEIIAFADGLAAEAERLGAARGQAFAMTLRGEAGILAGNLDQAEHDFAEGARLHGRIGAAAGEALSLLGRAQVATSRGQAGQARPYLADALLLARESEVGHHTLDRIYGAMVEAAPDPQAAVEVVAEAETAIRGPAETCPTCRIAFLVPATIAAARAGDLERAQRYAADCATALEIVALPPAWHAAVGEARGWVARAEGREDEARDEFAAAAEGFRAWDQPLDAARCATLATG
jgi:DNA-binding SARP family transcriptional activator